MGKWFPHSCIAAISVCILSGCIPVPLPPRGDIYISEHKIEESVDNGASKAEVVEHLGKPVKYRKTSMSYKACSIPAGVGVLVVGGLYGASFEEFRGETKCFELVLDFDLDNHLISYHEIPWEDDINFSQEDMMLKKLADQGDELAHQLWLQSAQYASELTFGTTQRQLQALANEGNADAQLQLYWNEPDHKDALKWLCRAADHGNAEAQYRLAVLYETGSNGVTKNLVKSYMWYQITASRGGYMRPADQAQRLREILTAEQAIQAEALLRNWKPGQCERELVPINTAD
jgi:hypothetical protein